LTSVLYYWVCNSEGHVSGMREISIAVMDLVVISEQKEILDKIFIDLGTIIKCTLKKWI